MYALFCRFSSQWCIKITSFSLGDVRDSQRDDHKMIPRQNISIKELLPRMNACKKDLLGSFVTFPFIKQNIRRSLSIRYLG